MSKIEKNGVLFRMTSQNLSPFSGNAPGILRPLCMTSAYYIPFLGIVVFLYFFLLFVSIYSQFWVCCIAA